MGRAPRGLTQVWGEMGARKSGEVTGSGGLGGVWVDAGAPPPREEAEG